MEIIKRKYRINEVKLDFEEDQSLKNIESKALKKIGIKNALITDTLITRSSIDARKKPKITMVYTLDFNLVNKKTKKTINLESKPKIQLSYAPNLHFTVDDFGSQKLENPPLVIGMGPAGLFAGLILAENGYNPIIVERGKSVEERLLDVEGFWNGTKDLNENSNVQFGEGGAGTFSDGKLTTGISDPRIRKVLETFVEHGADKKILIENKAHIGTDILRPVVANIRKKIISLGGQVLFSHLASDFKIEKGEITGITCNKIEDDGTISKKKILISSKAVVLATGHSSRDTFVKIKDIGADMKQKPFSIGARVEHAQKIVDLAQYGSEAIEKFGEKLPPASYKLSHRCSNGRGIYTFCMCPGGKIIKSASIKNTAVTNGMSYSKRDSGFANSALLVDVKTSDFPSDDVLAGIALQEKYEKLAYSLGKGYGGVVATWKDIREKTDAGTTFAKALPDFVIETYLEGMEYLGRKLNGFDSDDTLFVGVETRSSSPVTILRDKDYESNIKGLYPCGEGAGHAGGIMSAACDGIKVAQSIISKYAPIK